MSFARFARVETGKTLEEATADFAGKLGGPAIGGLLESSAVKQAISKALGDALNDPNTRAAVRSYLLEAAAYVGGAVLLAVLLARKL